MDRLERSFKECMAVLKELDKVAAKNCTKVELGWYIRVTKKLHRYGEKKSC